MPENRFAAFDLLATLVMVVQAEKRMPLSSSELTQRLKTDTGKSSRVSSPLARQSTRRGLRMALHRSTLRLTTGAERSSRSF